MIHAHFSAVIRDSKLRFNPRREYDVFESELRACLHGGGVTRLAG